MARKLRIGFVGLGRVFDLNVRGYLHHPEAEIAALCERDPALLARRAAEHPDALATADFEAFLRAGSRRDRDPHAASAARGDDGRRAGGRRACQRAKADGDDAGRMRPA